MLMVPPNTKVSMLPDDPICWYKLQELECICMSERHSTENLGQMNIHVHVHVHVYYVKFVHVDTWLLRNTQTVFERAE